MNWHYLYIFLQVNLLEIAVLLILFRRHLTFTQIVLSVTLANALTHPLVFFGRNFLPLSLVQSILAAEVFALVVEALIYQKLMRVPAKPAWIGSLTANFVSWQMGPVLTALFILNDRF